MNSSYVDYYPCAVLPGGRGKNSEFNRFVWALARLLNINTEDRHGPSA
jgi:hypothetical protein